MEETEYFKGILKKGAKEWNAMRKKYPEMYINLSDADLSGIDISNAKLENAIIWRANFCGANLQNAYLSRASLFDSNFSGADFRNATLVGTYLNDSTLINTNLSGAIINNAHLINANLKGAILNKTDFQYSNLTNANLTNAKLHNTDLRNTIIVGTNLEGAELVNCFIHGISVWDVKLKNTIQSNLDITSDQSMRITVDDLELAQFIYLLTENQNLTRILNTIITKCVLLLGRFDESRKKVLLALKDELIKRGYIPIIFDFDKPTKRNLTETMLTLAHLSNFVIADLTYPNSVPHEIASIVSSLSSVPIVPILQHYDNCGNENIPFSMFKDYLDKSWVSEIQIYEDIQDLIHNIDHYIIDNVEFSLKLSKLIKQVKEGKINLPDNILKLL